MVIPMVREPERSMPMISQAGLILTIALFLLGCAGEPVRIELSLDHPANPEAAESAFHPPPNPFLDEAQVPLPQTDNRPTMPDPESTEQPMDHGKDHGAMPKPTPESATQIPEGTFGHQHGGHHQ